MEPFAFAPRAASGAPALCGLPVWAAASPELTAGFTGRDGGVSAAPWQSLNLGLHVGDDPAAVTANRRRVAAALGWPFEAWTCAEQVHGDRVCRVTAADRGRGRDSRETAIPGCDAIMTDEQGILLVSFYADCVPLYFHDPEHGAVALAHAGWKGTALRIAARTVEAMAREFGSRPEVLRAAVGPAIGACCYEVDAPVIERMAPLTAELAADGGAAEADMLMRTGGGRARLNLKEINRQIMIKAGILPTRIECSGRCTGCERHLFYSHRLENGRTGRMASYIGMR